jgi:hypothetical protein
MTTKLLFTASIVKKGRGSYIARADELAITTAEASTQREAIKQLKRAVLTRFRTLAEGGMLTTVLDDAGYSTELIGVNDISLHPKIFNSATISVPLIPRISALNQKQQRKNMDERT